MEGKSRRDFLLEERDKKDLEDLKKVDKVITEGGALQNMLDTFGWKLLYEGFIQPNIGETRFLESPREDLADVRAEMRVLRRMLKFIETRVNEANKIATKIKK